jgi:hypothetical protein
MTKSELKQLIKEVISDSLKNESLLKYSTNPKEVLANIIEIAEDDNMDDFNKVINMRALAKGYFDKVGYKVTKEAVNDFPVDMERALKQAKKKGDHEQSAYYTQALKGGGSAYAGWDKFKGSWAYEQWLKKPETQELIKAIKYDYDRFSYMREDVSENYEDGIKDAKDRMAYLALRKQEKDYISKSKQSSSPIKKKHYMDMSKQVLDKALDILKKHKVVDEANTKELQKLGFTPTKSDVNEVKGYVLGPMDQASSWIAWNKKPKNKNGKQMYVVSAAEFQKQFPSIQMKELPAKPSYGADYYIIDGEGDLFPYSQANIGSGLD